MPPRIARLITRARNDSGGFLSDDLDLTAYTEKILSKATVVSYQHAGSIIAFIAYYDNDPALQEAFLTMILVDPDHKGKGLGKMLLDLSIRDLSHKGFAGYSLEVAKSNASAVALYGNSGFNIVEDRDQHWLMRKSLK